MQAFMVEEITKITRKSGTVFNYTDQWVLYLFSVSTSSPH